MQAVQRFRVTFLVIAAAINPLSALAQTPGPPLWNVDTVRSTILGESRSIFVALPPEYGDPAAAADSFPVIIVLDAHSERRFPIAVALGRMLSAPNAPEIPAAIVIGVETSRNRYHDMTLPPLEGPARTVPEAGGAPKFAQFLSDELIPLLRSRYRARTYTVLAGHSLTGLFAGYYFGQSSIDAVIALSPSLQWNDGVAYRQVIEGIRQRNKSGRFFLASGAVEGDLHANTVRLAAEVSQLNPRKVTLDHRVYERASHWNTWLQGLLDGMRFVFAPVSVAGHEIEGDDFPADKGAQSVLKYEELKATYLKGARELGLREALPRTFALGLARYANSNGNELLASQMCEDLTGWEPSYVPAYLCLGDASLKLGNKEKGEQTFNAALKIAYQRRDSASIKQLEERLNTLRSRKPK